MEDNYTIDEMAEIAKVYSGVVVEYINRVKPQTVGRRNENGPLCYPKTTLDEFMLSNEYANCRPEDRGTKEQIEENYRQSYEKYEQERKNKERKAIVKSRIDMGLSLFAIVLVVVAIFLYIFVFENSSSGDSSKKCAICGKKATFYLQDSYFCAEHANGLVEYYSN